MRYQGKIRQWNDKRGFGFVEPNGGGERAFVHVKAFKPRAHRPKNGDVISYDLVREKDNRYQARDIQFASAEQKSVKSTDSIQPRRRRRRSAKSSNPLMIRFILSFSTLLLLSVLFGKTPLIIAGLYIAMSFLAYIAYAIDKSAAQNGQWRTKESTLHILSLLGGWPGAYLAQNKFRHKTSKEEFKGVYWFTVGLNMIGLFWLHTEKGTTFLNKLISPLLT